MLEQHLPRDRRALDAVQFEPTMIEFSSKYDFLAINLSPLRVFGAKP